jgi:diguanylate cyclase (GGDEF)-like protein
MKIKRFTNSLITRLTLFGIFVVVASAIVRYNILIDFLESDQSEVAATQQSTIASYLAQDISYRIAERRQYLERLAEQLPPAVAADPQTMRVWLRERRDLQALFLQGLFYADRSGMIIADSPTLPDHRAMSLIGSPDYARVLEGSSVIGEPLQGPLWPKPVLPVMTPVLDASGHVVGVLGGITELDAPGFLEHLQQARLGPSGSFMLISPSQRMVIAANDPVLVFTPLPPPGSDTLLDQALTGFRGNGVGRSANGGSEIKAIATVEGTRWFVIASLPLAAALPTVDRMRHLIARGGLIQAAAIFVIIALAYVWFFRPLRRAADLADRMTRGEMPLSPLPVVRRDEVGHLTMAFNGLLARLKVHQSELQHQAHHDVLTGLPNRMMLAERMQQALIRATHEKTGIALLYLDLDGFKPVNDTSGHKAGDLVLQEIALRLRRVARHGDTLARLGGDEFVLLATGLSAPLQDGARVLAEKCIRVVSELVVLPQGEFRLGVSVGVALCDGRCDADSLLQAADRAMYAAKAQGRGCHVIAQQELGCNHLNAPAGTAGTNRPTGSAHS